MKDYRSLETKIRQVMEGRIQNGWIKTSSNTWKHPVVDITKSIDEQGVTRYFDTKGEEIPFLESNTEKRMAEPNVGRPDTAKNPLDPKAKLRKQAEIQTKIIDEAKKDEKASDKKDEKDDKPARKDKAAPKGSKDPDVEADEDDRDPGEIKGGKTEVDVHPTTNDNLTDSSKEKKDGDKQAKKENKKIGAKSAGAVKEDLFSAEELAYFELVLGEEYADMSKKNIDALINSKGKPHKVYTGTDETRHGMTIDELRRHLKIGDSPGVHKKLMHNLHTMGVRTGWSHSSGKWICYQGKKI